MQKFHILLFRTQLYISMVGTYAVKFEDVEVSNDPRQSLISSFLQFVSIQVEIASSIVWTRVVQKIHKETGKIAGERELENGAVFVFSNRTFQRRSGQVRRRWP